MNKKLTLPLWAYLIIWGQVLFLSLLEPKPSTIGMFVVLGILYQLFTEKSREWGIEMGGKGNVETLITTVFGLIGLIIVYNSYSKFKHR